MTTLDAMLPLRTPAPRTLAEDVAAGTRLLVASQDGLQHRRFQDLPDQLSPGDVLVVNVSATRPAAVLGVRPGGRRVDVHFSVPQPDGSWSVELRLIDRSGPVTDAAPGDTLELPGGATLLLHEPVVAHRRGGVRLWRASLRADTETELWLTRHARLVAYGHARPRTLHEHQTVFARQPGSAEMPSAGRPFTADLVLDLVIRGVHVVPVVLHSGVSSLEVGERPEPERLEVPLDTARVVNMARSHGRRVVAVGTTVVRALESAVVSRAGTIAPVEGWTDLVLSPSRPARVVGGLITGWHDDGASHLDVLRAVAGSRLVERAYAEARAVGYERHEFGDSCLLLPDRRVVSPGR